MPLESVLGSLGLDQPWKRFVFTTAAGVMTEYYIKPSYAFEDNGNPKPVAFLNDSPGATYTFIGVFPALAGVITALYL